MKKLLQKKIFIPAIILLLIGGGIAYGKSRNKTEPEEKTPKVAGVSVETIATRSTINIPIKVTGQIKGKQTTEIRSLVEGVLQTLMPVGSQIKQGSPLFRIANQSVEAQYQNALNVFNNAKLTTTETEASASNSLVQAQLAVDQAKTNLELAEQALIDGETTASLNLKIANDNASITHQQGYHLLEDVIRYLGSASLADYVFDQILSANQTALFDAREKFIVAKTSFLNQSSSTSSDLKKDLENLRSSLVTINTLNNATITLLNFAVEGNNFSKNDLTLAKSQTATFRNNLNSLQTTLSNSQNSLENVESQNRISLLSLRKKTEISEIQLENAKTSLASQQNASAIQKISASGSLSGAVSQLAVARRSFQNLQVPAPFAGTVISHKSTSGSQVSPGQTILELGNLNIVEIKINLSDSLANGLRLEQSVKIDGQEIGRVSEIEAAANLSSGKVGITIEADNRNNQFTSGNIADIEFDLTFETDGAIMIPLKLVKISQDSKFVLIIREGKVIEQPVQLGQLFNNQVVVTQGLINGDMIIVENGGFLSEGDPVKINQ